MAKAPGTQEAATPTINGSAPEVIFPSLRPSYSLHMKIPPDGRRDARGSSVAA